MKRCSQCRRDYFDDTLFYCLDDGSALLDGPVGAQPSGALAKPTEVMDRVELAAAGAGARAPDLKISEGKYHSNAVAVLPFANLSRNEENEYFSDGLAEELLNVLSKVNGLRVAARTSAFAFKGKQVSVKDIGTALQVESVLEGSVRMAGERVRIAVQLVNAGDGYQLWSETYDRKMDDIFAIQDDIAQSVVGELRKRLLGEPNAREKVADEVAAAIKGRTADPEAQRLMLLGRYLAMRLNEADNAKATEYFRKAIEIDPDYASCWSELGRVLYLAAGLGWRSSGDTGFDDAERALRKALALEPELPEGYSRLGRIRLYRYGDFSGAKQYLERAMALGPDNIDVLTGAAHLARELGQFEKAIDYCQRAAAIDPLSPSPWFTALTTNFSAGHLDAAELAGRRALELAPQRVSVHAWLGLILLMQGRMDEALAEALLETDDDAWRSWALAIIYHAAGRQEESDQALRKLFKEYGDVAAFQMAEAHAMRGAVDKAFEWLERAVDVRDPGRFQAKVSYLLRPLHNDPRWPSILRKIGFPDDER